MEKNADEDDRPSLKMDHIKIIVRSLGPQGTWGKGDTIAEARKIAKNPKYYEVFIATYDTTCSSGDGGFVGDKDYWPRKIHEVVPKPKKVTKSKKVRL